MKNLLLENFSLDWAQLRLQKLTLLNLIDEAENNHLTTRKDDLTGILHLIDYIQDQGVESGVWTEEDVFDIDEDDICHPDAIDGTTGNCMECGSTGNL